MKIFDAHCDTLSAKDSILKNDGHFDVERAIKRGAGIQMMASFGKNQVQQLQKLHSYELSYAVGNGNLELMPSIEGMDAVSTLEDVEELVRLGLGIRFAGLTWNHDNKIAGGCHGNNPLTNFGRDVVRYLQEKNVTVDLAHASEKTFWDVCEISRKPLIVSHTCCAALRPHRRNLSDAQLRAVSASGGVVGITFYNDFLSAYKNVGLDTVATHIVHVLQVAGEDSVGIGSDFDGCSELPEGLCDVLAVPRLIETLPVSDRIREKIAFENFYRIINT